MEFFFPSEKEKKEWEPCHEWQQVACCKPHITYIDEIGNSAVKIYIEAHG